MKSLFMLFFLIIAAVCKAQDKPKEVYSYYFIEASPTGKLGIEVAPEKGIVYQEIDSLLVTERTVSRKGVPEVVGKKYGSFSEFFNLMGKHGLEFVNHYKWNVVGGGTSILAGRMEVDYFMFRKKIIAQ